MINLNLSICVSATCCSTTSNCWSMHDTCRWVDKVLLTCAPPLPPFPTTSTVPTVPPPKPSLDTASASSATRRHGRCSSCNASASSSAAATTERTDLVAFFRGEIFQHALSEGLLRWLLSSRYYSGGSVVFLCVCLRSQGRVGAITG